MFKRHLASLLVALPLAAAAAPETYLIDPLHTYPNFSVAHLGLSTLHGRFERVTGKVVLDRAARTGMVDITIPTATVNTGDLDKGNRSRSRDDHLRSGDFFNANVYPNMVFKSTSIAFDGDAPSVIDGELMLRGVTRPVRLTIVKFGCHEAAGNDAKTCGGDATGKFLRSDFGIKTGLPAIGDEVTLSIEFEGTRL